MLSNKNLILIISEIKNIFIKKKKKFASFGICGIFAFAIRERGLSKCCKRFGSSVWLEYMPVTHGVASSSLVRTAKQKGSQSMRAFFMHKTIDSLNLKP